jgi:parallel beta-helix repeat protein
MIFKNGMNGIFIGDMSNIYIVDCNVSSHGDYGISISVSSKINMTNCNFSNNKYGIYLWRVSESKFRNNHMFNNSYNFGVTGYYIEEFTLDIDTSNTINDKIIYYLVGISDMEISPSTGYGNAGYIGVIDSNNVTVKDLNLQNNYQGVLLYSTKNSSVESMDVLNNLLGIRLQNRHHYRDEPLNNTIINCNTSSNEYGISLYEASNNNITECNVVNNSENGIRIHESPNNDVKRNYVSKNNYGIYLNWLTPNNLIYHNNLIDNTNQAYDITNNGNQWDNGYPSGGNYWSDYTGSDFFSGPNQNISGSDGIGDTDYSIDSDSVDNYPLMVPEGMIPPATIDELRITNTPNGNEIDDIHLNVGNEITLYASGYNNSIGYVGLIDVNWSQSLTIGNFNNIIGNSTTFTAGISEGTTIITGTNSTLGISDSFNLSINAPTADYIEVHDAPSGSGNIVDTVVFNVQDNFIFYAAGFNNTVGYFGDVGVDWTISPPSGVGIVVAGPNDRTTFTAVGVGTCIVTATYSPTVSSSTGLLTVEEIEPVVSYILIRDAPGGAGNVVTIRTYGVYDDDMFYAAAYDSGDNYIMDLEVTWSTSSSSVGAIDTTTGIATNFTAQHVLIDSICTITAEYDSSTSASTGDLTVLAPTVDEIRIVDSSSVGANEIADQTVIVDFEIIGYAASFNDTIGYLYDIMASWDVNNAMGSTASTFPAMGFSSDFNTEINGGIASWTADDDNGHTDTVIFTIMPPTVDFIIIRDAPNAGGFEATTDFFWGGDTVELYAAAYNNTAGYLLDVDVTWTCDDTTVGQVTSPGNSTIFSAQTITATSTCMVTAIYSAQIADSTGLITVYAPLTAPDPPAKPTIIVKGNDSIQLTWTPNTESNIAGYFVYRRELSNDEWEPVGLILDPDITSYTDKGLEPDTKYYYVVTAINNDGLESNPSPEVSATTADEKDPPDVPEPGDDEKRSLFDYWWLFVIIVLVIIILIIGLLLIRKQPPVIH